MECFDHTLLSPGSLHFVLAALHTDLLAGAIGFFVLSFAAAFSFDLALTFLGDRCRFVLTRVHRKSYHDARSFGLVVSSLFMASMRMGVGKQGNSSPAPSDV
jgi:hypothetical protein